MPPSCPLTLPTVLYSSECLCVSHVMPCGNKICIGTSARVISSLSTNCYPSNVFCVACVDVMSANLPSEWQGLLPAGL